MNYITILFLLFFINITSQVNFSIKNITSGETSNLIPIVNFQYDSVNFEPEIGKISKVHSTSTIFKNGINTTDKLTLHNWKVCDINKSKMTYLISTFFQNDSIVYLDTSLFDILPYPLKKFGLSITSNISEIQNKGSFFKPDTTWKSILKKEGLLIKSINSIFMEDFNFMKEAKYIVKSFSLIIHKKNGKIIKEIFVENEKISEDINRELRRYKNGYVTLLKINAELECGLKINAVSDEKIYLKFIK
jgi:hypothetical protein